jgi:SAM-dependent methyltransferase
LGKPATSSYLKRWKRESGTKVLNLGGGGNLREEWLTADVSPRADVFVDCSKTLPFADGTIEGLMLEEVIEHLDYLQGLRLLKECNRVLRNDGLLRVSTPDLSWFAELQRKPIPGATEQATADFANREGCRLLGTSDAPDELIRVAALNSIFLCHGHRFVYTSQSLEELFGLAGFQFRRSLYRDAHSKLARLDTHAERFSHPPEISLYYDAWKKA